MERGVHGDYVAYSLKQKFTTYDYDLIMLSKLRSYHSSQKLLNELTILVAILSHIVLSISVLNLFRLENLFCELSINFISQYFFLGIFFIATSIFIKDKKCFICGILIVITNSIYFYPYTFSQANDKNISNLKNVSIFSSNVLTQNAYVDKVIEVISSRDADIIFLQEIDWHWTEKLKSLKHQYPFNYSVLRKDNFGIGIYSKYDLTDCKQLELTDGLPPAIICKALISSIDFHLIAIHTVPPTSSRGYELRNRELIEVANIVKDLPGNIILAGDLNTAIWSKKFEDFIQHSKLTNTRLRFGILPTWPSYWTPLKIPLDQILVSDSIDLESLIKVKIPGSDHDALFAEVRF